MQQISKQEGIRRLEILKARLLSMPPERRRAFDMGHWFHLCGTASCALGEACMIPEFNKLGLVKGLGLPLILDANRNYTGLSDFVAGAAFFGIDCAQSEYIFAPSAYDRDEFTGEDILPEFVCEHIDEVISELKQGISNVAEKAQESPPT